MIFLLISRILIESLRSASDAKKVVGVVGLGHLDGIEKHWKRCESIFSTLVRDIILFSAEERRKELRMSPADVNVATRKH